MANYICRTVNEDSGYMQAQLIVPEGAEIYPGDIYIADTLGTDRHFNFTYYVPSIITDVTKQLPCIVLNGEFETLKDGRRPKGNPDYTQYIFKEGDVITAIRLIPELKLEISYDCISNANEIVGLGYLIPENNGTTLKYVQTEAEINSKVYLKIDGLRNFRLGGLFGTNYAETMIVRVKYKNFNVPANDPDITGIEAEVIPNLQVGNENVASGATVLTMEAQGGTAPYTYELVPNETLGADNDKFVIGSAEVKVGSEALNEAKTYAIYVRATDSKQKTFQEGFDIPVIAAADGE